jgi:formylmethanofuran dehydrogenase subunit E
MKKKSIQSMTAEKILSSEDFQRCIGFHGHICPGLAIGFQAARVLMRWIGVERSPDEELVATVETDACGADAIQVMTGCTFGKGNFIFMDHGKHAFSLSDRKQGKTVRVCLRSNALPNDPEHLSLFEKVRNEQATAEEIKLFKQLREERLQNILDAEPESLFTIEEISAEIPPQARITESEVCDRCGEPTMVKHLQDVKGKNVCIPCARRLFESKPR